MLEIIKSTAFGSPAFHTPRFFLLALIGFSFFSGSLLLAACSSAQAQQPQKMPIIGRLGASSASAEVARLEAFRQGLRELGYIEGKNILIEWREAEGKPDRFPHSLTSLCASRWTSSSREEVTQLEQSRERLLRSRS
jgi:hypothetical protein